MKRPLLIALGLAAVSAANVHAQLTNFPVYALPSAGDAPATFVAAGFGRGLNEDSGKENAFGLFVGRTGVGDRLTFGAGAAMVNYDPDAKYSFGGSAAVDMLPPGQGSAQVAVQAGIGYISLADEVWSMNFPIGVALKTEVAAGSATVSPWVMPRVHLMRASVLGLSSTETEFGVSGGAAVSTASGLGFHAALDLLATDPSVWVVGAGVHYMIP